MTNDNKNKFTFLVGYLDFHKDQAFNFQLNRWYSMMRYFSDQGYEVIAFEGPGQGAARKKYGLAFAYEWEKPSKAILNHFKLRDITWFGISMGGWLGLRAAAYEPRIKRVIASSVFFDVNQYINIVGQQLAKLFFRHLRNFRHLSLWNMPASHILPPYC